MGVCITYIDPYIVYMYVYYAIQLIFGPIGKRLPRSVRASVSKGGGGGGEEKTAIPNWLHLQISAISSSPRASSSMLCLAIA